MKIKTLLNNNSISRYIGNINNHIKIYNRKNATNVLQNAKEILIEVNDNFHDQAENIRNILNDLGFKMIKKLHSEYIENNDEGFENTYNQIWTKDK